MKNYKLILLVTVISFLNFSCLVDDTEDTSFGESPYVVGFAASDAALSYFTDIGVVRRDFPVELLGGFDGTPSASAISISYVIDPASTATLGQEFDFVSNTGILDLPAGGTFVNFPLDVNTANFNPDAPTTLILNLTGTNSDSSVVATPNQTLTITFVGCQADLLGTYSVTNDECGSVATTNIEGNADGSWSLGIGDGYFLAGCTTNDTLLNPAVINIICGDVQVVSQPQFCSSNEIGCITSGTWDAVSGTLTMEHTDNFFDGGPFTWTSTYVRQ